MAKTTAPAARRPRTTTSVPETITDALGFVMLDDAREPVNIAYYGKEGAGKTTAAVSMANLGRTLVVNAEGGLKRKPLLDRGINTGNIAVYPPPGVVLTFENLQGVYNQIATDLAKDPSSWAGVVFDSATDIYQTILDEVSSARTERIRNTGKEVDEWFVDISDYGTMSKMFRFLLRRFRDLPCHFAVTALERRDVDEDTGTVAYGPAVTPALATDLLGYVDFVLHTRQEDENGPFRAATKRRGKYRAKDRFGVLPAVMVDPSFERIMSYKDGTLTEADDPLQARLQTKPTQADKQKA